MKILLTPLLILTASLFPIKEKTGQLVDQSKVIYNVNDEKLLDGVYQIEDASKTTRIRGNYAGNKRSGNWYCFNAKGEVVLRYNYDQKKLIALDQNELKTIEFKVLDKDPEVVKNATIPLPICSIEQFKSLIIGEFKDEIPVKLKQTGGEVEVEITANVNADGTCKYFANYNVKGLSYTAKVYPKDKLFTIEWLPATYKEKTYKSEIKFSSKFNLDASDHKRFIWNY